ncbi:BTB/POZ domain-containing protein [Striga hermonthica]|uniref:BTB/POZ domain-containing protein n=1 Tax=Striga hermonthica TaxID=68872 RepID=A0A9N7RDS4_STRHE|nr:BTB/POZ domain-containing protein [Striga hermonthica]
MDKHHHQQQLPPQKTASQRCSEWVFRDVPSDIVIEVDGATFALHKFPLVSRSGRIRKLIAEHRESDVSRIELLGLPGGLESFELAAQFCYGINFEITASNAARLICVSDYLEMTDDYSPNNLASRAEEYLDSVVCKSLEMCVEVLQYCENLLPLADELQIVSRCVDAIASKACVEQIASSFSRLESAVALGCTDGCRVELERRIGAQLEMATLDDLLIPSFHHAGDTLFDVETVHRIIVNFAQMEVSEEEEEEEDMDMDMEEGGSGFGSDGPSQTSLCTVSKLIDSYLAEIAPDGNLKLTMFVAIAEALPAHARTVHDGLYRAIDIYLKAHQGLLEAEKRKLCKLIDFQKLSQEAGAHAAQNERLPVQSIVQVLYYEQQRLKNSLFYTEDEPGGMKAMMQQPSWRINSGARSAAMSPRDNYASLRRENRDLKLELARMRMRLNDLEKDHVYMKRNLERSGSRKLMSSFSKKFINIFGHGSSRGSMSPSRQSQMSEARFMERT